MATLSELVKFRNELAVAINSLSLDEVIAEKIPSVASVQLDNPITQSEGITPILARYQDINKEVNSIKDSLRGIIDNVDVEITSSADQLIHDPEHQRTFSLATINLQNRLDHFDTNRIKERVSSYNDWHYPGLHIYPDSKEWVDVMVACDPLYLVNHDISLLTNMIGSYPEIYQRRLRLYDNFNQLPKNQFGFVLAWNFLNFLTFDQIEHYLRTVWDLLRPGGLFIFNYNNCDLDRIAKLSESHSKSYASGRRLRLLINTVGYETVTFEDNPTDDEVFTHICWAEIRKPGTLHTVKLQQAAGKILPK